MSCDTGRWTTQIGGSGMCLACQCSLGCQRAVWAPLPVDCLGTVLSPLLLLRGVPLCWSMQFAHAYRLSTNTADDTELLYTYGTRHMPHAPRQTCTIAHAPHAPLYTHDTPHMHHTISLHTEGQTGTLYTNGTYTSTRAHRCTLHPRRKRSRGSRCLWGTGLGGSPWCRRSSLTTPFGTYTSIRLHMLTAHPRPTARPARPRGRARGRARGGRLAAAGQLLQQRTTAPGRHPATAHAPGPAGRAAGERAGGGQFSESQPCQFNSSRVGRTDSDSPAAWAGWQ